MKDPRREIGNIYVPKDSNEFAKLVANHAHRCPSSPIGSLILTEYVEGRGINLAIDMDVYEQGKSYAVEPNKVIEEVLKSE